MEWLELRCRKENCEVDNTTLMDLNKCCSQGGTFKICYQLSIKKREDIQKGEVWQKLGSMIGRVDSYSKKK